MSAQVINLFPASSERAEEYPDVDVDRYATVAERIVARCGDQGMDPKILAGAIVAVVTAQEVAAELADLDDDSGPCLPVPAEPVQRFQGAKCASEYRDVTDIARDYRRDVKTARASGELVLPAHAKVSVRCEKYSQGQAISAIIQGLTPGELWNSPGAGWQPAPGDDGREVYNGGKTALRIAAEGKLTELLQAYNRSESGFDYHNSLFHVDVTSAQS